MPHLTLKLLGQFQALIKGAPAIGFNSDKTRALLAYLAVEADRAHRRESLAGLLWPDVTESAARQSLSQALSNLRKVLRESESPQPFILADRDTVGWNRAADYALDVDGLKQSVTSDVYRGQLLDGFTLPDAGGFEEWLLLKRERVQRNALDAFDAFVAAKIESGDYVAAIDASSRQLEIDPWREETHRQLMRTYALNGQRGDALSQYERCKKMLAEALGVDPSPQTEALLQQIKTGTLHTHADSEADTTAAPERRAVAAQRSENGGQRTVQLPQALTPFIGREHELSDLRRLLADPQARFITITGLGGMGKTRLAIQAGQLAAADPDLFVHGVVFVSLAPLTGAEQIAPAIAAALRFNLSNQEDPHGQLLDLLRDKSLLIILDNAEHLLAHDAAELARTVADLITVAGRVTVLMTSREALQTAGEWVYPVDGFTTGSLPLFVQSARRVRAGFQLSPAEEPTARRICQLVDNMPLGIELAAAWVNVLSLDEIVEEIARGLDVLTVSKRDVADRHRSLTAVLDQSWALLPPDERVAVERLSVFRGSFTRDMAKQAAGTSLATLAQLVSKSLLRRVEGGRYDLHELMRQYAGARLTKQGDAQAARRNHALAYLTLAEVTERKFYGPEANHTVQTLAPEQGNFRTALEWSTGEDGDPCTALRLAAALVRYFYMLPNWHEGDRWLREALARADCVDDALLVARAQMGLGMMTHAWGNFEDALRVMSTALATFEQLGQSWHTAWTLCQMYQCDFAEGRIDQAEEQAARSLTLFRSLADEWATAYVTWQLGHLAKAKGDHAKALALAGDSRARFERLGDVSCTVLTSNLLGSIATLRGDLQQAREHFAWSLQRCQAHGIHGGIGWCEQELGEVALMQHDAPEAVRWLSDALVHRHDIGDPIASYECVQGLGIAAAQLGDYMEAMRLFGAAARDRRGDGFLMKVWLEPVYTEARNAARQGLGESQWHAAWHVGHATPLPNIVATIRDRAHQQVEARILS